MEALNDSILENDLKNLFLFPIQKPMHNNPSREGQALDLEMGVAENYVPGFLMFFFGRGAQKVKELHFRGPAKLDFLNLGRGDPISLDGTYGVIAALDGQAETKEAKKNSFHFPIPIFVPL